MGAAAQRSDTAGEGARRGVSPKVVLGLGVAGLAGLLLLAAAFYVLVTPNNPLTRLFQARISAGGERVVTGPYPLDHDFDVLQQGGVTTVVTLLDPKLPYEAVLLQRERKAAAKRGLTLLEFPMTSVLGRSFGAADDRDRQVAAAAAAIAKAAPGKVYLHCYLGVHRTKRVTDLLKAEGVASGAYTERQGERTAAARSLDQAQQAFEAGRYQEVLQLLRPGPDLEARSAVLLGWSNYRLGNLDAAREMFQAAARTAPETADAHNGQGFVALRQGDLATADREFALVLARDPADPTALEGLTALHNRQAGARP